MNKAKRPIDPNSIRQQYFRFREKYNSIITEWCYRIYRTTHKKTDEEIIKCNLKQWWARYWENSKASQYRQRVKDWYGRSYSYFIKQYHDQNKKKRHSNTTEVKWIN